MPNLLHSLPRHRATARKMDADSLGFHEVLLCVLHLGWPSRRGTAPNADIWRVMGHYIEVRIWREVPFALQHNRFLLMLHQMTDLDMRDDLHR